MAVFLVGTLVSFLLLFGSGGARAFDARYDVVDELTKALRDGAYYGDCSTIETAEVAAALKQEQLPACIARDRFARYSAIGATRAPSPSLDWSNENSTYTLFVPSFVEEVAVLVHVLLTAADAQKPVIIDLRNNGGGLLVHLQDFLCLFAGRETDELYRWRKRGGEWRTITAHVCAANARGRFHGRVRAVLVNGATASAAEVAAAFFRHSGIPLLGTTTFGKNMMQQMVPLSPLNYFRFTFGGWRLGQ